MKIEEFIKVATKKTNVTTLFKNVNLVNVISGNIEKRDVAIYNKRVIGFGDYKADEVIDLNGKFMVPGLIDGHIHLESSMLTPREFANSVIPLGTTTVIADPHEIVNVLGAKGIDYMIDATENIPLNVFFMLPSCVPATPLERNGSKFTLVDMMKYKKNPRVLGLAEMMNFPGVLTTDDDVMEKIEFFKHDIIDGHAPGLLSDDLNAYAGSFIKSDHECTTVEEAYEKLSRGMHIFIREGSATKDLEALLPVLKRTDSDSLSFVTDDKHPKDLIGEGHINYMVKKAISLGYDPMRIIKLATINNAQYFGLRDIGAIVPGYKADFIIVDSLEEFNIEKVYKDGDLVAENGKIKKRLNPFIGYSSGVEKTFKCPKLSNRDFDIKHKQGKKANVIEIIEHQIITKWLKTEVRHFGGFVACDKKNDIIKIANIYRHGEEKEIGLGLIKGFGITQGAIATSIGHDSHNITTVGINEDDMAIAVNRIIDMEGGLVVVKDGKIIEEVQLNIAGLIGNLKVNEMNEKMTKLNQEAYNLGIKIKEPFMTMSFLALSVIPTLKITTKGLFNIETFSYVPLFE